MKQTWASKLREERGSLKRSIAMRGLADYIAMSFLEHEQDQLIALLQNPTMQTRIIIEVTEKPKEPREELK